MKWTLFFALALLAACATPVPFKKSTVPVVFLHGSHFSADLWRDVLRDWPQERPLLTLSLPDRAKQPSMKLMPAAEFACGSIARPSVLVAHSFGGIVVQQMVALCPEKIKQIIYVTAMTSLPGEEPFSTFSKAEQDYYSRGVKFSKELMSPLSREQFMAMMAGPGHKFDPLWPTIHSEYTDMGQKSVTYNLDVWLAIPKAYIVATQDQVILPGTQQVFLKKGKIETVRELQAGHLPMVTHPKELAKIIADLSLI